MMQNENIEQRVTTGMLLGATWNSATQMFWRVVRCDETAKLRTIWYDYKGMRLENHEVLKQLKEHAPLVHDAIVTGSMEGEPGRYMGENLLA